jgi:hypothetical protein
MDYTTLRVIAHGNQIDGGIALERFGRFDALNEFLGLFRLSGNIRIQRRAT